MRGWKQRAAALGVTVALVGAAAGCGSHQDASGPRSTDWAPAARTVGGLRVLAQSDARGLRLHTASGDKTFLPGINLGSSVPGHQPGEVGSIPASQYRTWFGQMHDLGIRVVRIYTLLSPGFYDELDRWNTAHARDPLYLVQGVYLPDEDYNTPGHTLYTPAVDRAFTDEISDVSAAVHGDLTRPQVPGRAGGTYRTDVSRWVASWIIGVEWDPEGTLRTDRVMRRAAYTPGRYFRATPGATATERWIARHVDHLATLEAARGTSVPVAFANWPTADPLHHPTEPLRQEDLVSVDANHVLPTRAWPGGTFASFHAYPYYPDFQRYEPGLDKARWQGRSDRYAGYLLSLQRHFAAHMPLVVSEFGVPASLGTAHAGTNGRGQGAHSEQEAMAMDASMMRMMQSIGLGGGFVFSWADEWFKRTWNTMEHQDPARRQLWHDPLTNEQWFGITATDTPQVPDAAAEKLPTTGATKYLYAWADYSYVHLEVTGRTATPTTLTAEADVVPGAEKADYRLALDRGTGAATWEVRRALDPMRLDTDQTPYRPDAAAPWHLFELITNRAQRGHPAEYADIGRLRRGSWDPTAKGYDSRATWDVDEAHDTVRVRIPWSMLGMADPSSRTALGEGTPARMVTIPGIGLDLVVDGQPEHLDLTWPTWNRVVSTERVKAGAGVLAQAYRDLAP
ncbi:hypothetical protein GCM10027596_08520 [Nocardioides korecus]